MTSPSPDDVTSEGNVDENVDAISRTRSVQSASAREGMAASVEDLAAICT